MVDFFQPVREVTISEKFSSYYNGVCPFCGSKNYTIEDVRHRYLQDMGGPTRKVTVDLEVKTIRCLEPTCGMVFTPEHPYYPPFLHYSIDVVQFALMQAHNFTRSAEDIADQLLTNHNVTVDPKTIQSWINTYSEQYFQTYFIAKPETALQDFKALTIDGTYFTSGKDVIGKKKAVESLSVTKLADGVFLVTWWE
jgi:hypothetical protein